MIDNIVTGGKEMDKPSPLGQEKTIDELFGLNPNESLESARFATVENLYLHEYQTQNQD